MSNNTISIPLSGNLGAGKFMLIDEADAHLFADFPKFHLSCGYAAARKSGKRVLAHRLVLDPPAETYIDHINGDRLDNRRENLRLCTTGENNRNKGKEKGSGEYKGVAWNKRCGNWLAYIARDGLLTSLGSFASAEFAAQVYDAAAHRYHGEFARLNTPGVVTEAALAYLAEWFGPRWRITSPEGEVMLIDSLQEACNQYGLTRTGMFYVSQGRNKQHKGWKCERISTMPVRRGPKPPDLV